MPDFRRKAAPVLAFLALAASAAACGPRSVALCEKVLGSPSYNRDTEAATRTREVRDGLDTLFIFSATWLSGAWIDAFAVEFSNIYYLDPARRDATIALWRGESTAIAEPMQLQGHEVTVTASIGISVFPDDGSDVSTVLANADIAMYRAKALGHNRVTEYSSDLGESVVERFEIEKGLREGLRNNEFHLYYQPKIAFSSGKLLGVEALNRGTIRRWACLDMTASSPSRSPATSSLLSPSGLSIRHADRPVSGNVRACRTFRSP